MTQAKSLSLSASFGAHGLVAATLLLVPLLGRPQLPAVTIIDLPAPMPPLVARVVLPPTVDDKTQKQQTRGGDGGPLGGTILPGGPAEIKPFVTPSLNGIAAVTDDDLELWKDEGFPFCFGRCTGKGPRPPGPGDGPLITDGALESPVRAGHGHDYLVTDPRRIDGPEPVYPPMARAARVQGTVVLECRLAVNGKVENIVVRSGHPLLNDAAVEAVRQWRYVPTLLNGRPVEVLLTVTVQFRLR